MNEKTKKYVMLAAALILAFALGFVSDRFIFKQSDITGYNVRIYDGRVELYNASETHVLGDAKTLLASDPFYAAGGSVISDGQAPETIREKGVVVVYSGRSSSSSSGGSSSGGSSSSGDGQDIQWSDDML